MSEQAHDGGPAFPQPSCPDCGVNHAPEHIPGMSLRDYFAAHCQEDDRLVKCVRAMDDSALEIFALHPTCERDEHLTEIDLTVWAALPSEVAKVAKRLELEAAAIARVRFMQADAMLKVRAEVERTEPKAEGR